MTTGRFRVRVADLFRVFACLSDFVDTAAAFAFRTRVTLWHLHTHTTVFIVQTHYHEDNTQRNLTTYLSIRTTIIQYGIIHGAARGH